MTSESGGYPAPDTAANHKKTVQRKDECELKNLGLKQSVHERI